MNRCAAVLVLLAALSGLATHAGAATPVGPRLAISVFTDGPGAEDESWEVITTGPSGESPQRLVGGLGALIGDSLSWSAAGDRLAFSVSGVESTAEEPFGIGWPVAAVAKLNEGGSFAFPRAFLNGDVGTGSVKRLTRWRLSGFLDPSSFSPDGSTLAVDSFGYRVAEGAVAVDLRSGRLSLLARKVMAINADGTCLTRVFADPEVTVGASAWQPGVGREAGPISC